MKKLTFCDGCNECIPIDKAFPYLENKRKSFENICNVCLENYLIYDSEMEEICIESDNFIIPKECPYALEYLLQDAILNQNQ